MSHRQHPQDRRHHPYPQESRQHRGDHPYRPYEHGQGRGHSHQIHGQPSNAPTATENVDGPVVAYTNHFRISSLPTKKYLQYSVFDPETPKQHFKKRNDIIRKLQNEIAPSVFSPRALFDGTSILYAAEPGLKFPHPDQNKYTVNMASNPKSEKGVYKVTLTKTAGSVVDPSIIKRFSNPDDKLEDKGPTNPDLTTSLNVVQLILRSDAEGRHPYNKRAYFPGGGADETNSQRVRCGVTLVRGYFQSLKPVIKDLLVNVDTVTAVMYQSGDAVLVAKNHLGVNSASELQLSKLGSHGQLDRDFKDLHKFFIGVKVKLRHLNTPDRERPPVKIVRDIVPYAGSVHFEYEKRSIDITEYFRRCYNITLKYPNIVGFQLSSDPKRSIVVPMELCDVEPGQFYKRGLPSDFARDVVRFSAVKPRERRTFITNNSKAPIKMYGQSETIVQSGMSVSNSLVRVYGTNLAVPSIHFNGDTAVLPSKGAWGMIDRRQKLHTCGKIKKLACINFSPLHNAENIACSLIECCRRRGMEIEANSTRLGNKSNCRQTILEVVNGLNIETDLLVIILPENGEGIRNDAKRICDIELGIRSQCLRESKLRGTVRDQYLTNVTLKINARMGGINFVPSNQIMNNIATHNVMVCGADVSHPGPGIRRPSIAALVASCNSSATQYSAFSNVQMPRQEVVSDLRTMFKNALEVYKKEMKRNLPKCIVFFRDGISEGEYREVFKVEAVQLKKAVDEYWIEQKFKEKFQPPSLAYIVVGKRNSHHTTFFSEEFENMEAGFVTDEGISNPFVLDFFQQGHSAIQGTARTAHAVVISDGVFGNNPNVMKRFFFTMCHVYQRATCSVSLPAPVYYADLVCGRSKFHWSGADPYNYGNEGDPFGAEELAHWKTHYGEVHPNLVNKMYFL